MRVEIKFLLRNSTGDQPIATDAELRDLLQRAQCKPGDFLFDFGSSKWGRVGDHPTLASLFADKPVGVPDRRVIYFLAPGGDPKSPQGPLSTREIQVRAQGREIGPSTWVFVEGDKEWRQIRAVKILADMLPALPTDRPSPPAPIAVAPAAAPAPELPVASGPPPFSLTAAPSVAPPASVPVAALEPEIEAPSMPSIKLDLGGPSAPPPRAAPAVPASAGHASDDDHVEREEITMALDTMGLNLHSQHANLPPSPPKPARPGLAPLPSAPGAAPPSGDPATSPKAPPPVGGISLGTPPHGTSGLSLGTPPHGTPAPGKNRDAEGFDGIVAEIPMDPIWLVKPANGETVSGPFRFLEVIQFLEQGRLTKNDKIARAGTKAFVKIQQQYEFNVKFSIETVVENGQEKQKILIRRRHPRVPYITGVQIVSKHGLLAGQCVNISAGGILMEVPKAEFNLGEIIEVKILPGLIAKSITCKSLIIGKIPKIPPGYALKFEDLKPEDKEVIEHYVQETLKREMSKKN